MVAEWRKALAGVGAVMPAGSQKWKGHWALLVRQPRAIRTVMPAYQGWPCSAMPRMSAISNEPAAEPRITRPASRASPPPAVTTRACRPAARAAGVRS
jgi:hypothetical protein